MVKMKDSKIEWIGQIPENWKIIPIYTCTSEITQKNSDLKEKRALKFTYGNIVDKTNFNIDEDPSLTQTASNYLVVKPNDIVINGLNLNYDFITQRVGIVKKNGIITSAYIGIRPTQDDVIPKYLLYLFKTYDAEKAFHNMGGGVRKILNYSELKKEKMVLPSLLQQQAIISFLDKKCTEIDNISTQIQKEIDTLQKYRKSVITKTVTKGLDDTVPMKESGIEWIGKIPETWKLEKIKFLTSKIQKGLSPQYQDKGKTNIITQATFSKGYWDESSLKKAITSHRDEKLNLVKKHDILLATTGGGVLGKTYFIKKDINYVASADVVFIRGNDKRIINKLIYYCLFINYNLLNGIMAQGSTNQLHLNVNNLKNFKLPVGSIDVQQRIVNYLDNKTSQIDKIISQKQKQLSLLSDYKNSLIFEYVTGKKQISSNGGEK